MKLWGWVLVLLAAAAAAAFGWHWLADDPGYLLLRLRGTTVETVTSEMPAVRASAAKSRFQASKSTLPANGGRVTGGAAGDVAQPLASSAATDRTRAAAGRRRLRFGMDGMDGWLRGKGRQCSACRLRPRPPAPSFDAPPGIPHTEAGK